MRFTIRDVLWLTLLAAVLVAWWVDRRAQSQRIEELEQRQIVFFSGDLRKILPTAAPVSSPPPAPGLPP